MKAEKQDLTDTAVQPEKNRRKKVLVTVLLCLSLALLAFLTRQGLNAPESDYDSNQSAWNKPLPQTQQRPGIQIPGFGTITVKADETSWQIPLINPEGNPCDLKYVLRLEQDGNPLFETDLIRPGNAVSSIPVSRTLEPGEYELLFDIMCHAGDEKHTQLNGALVRTKLIVL